MLASITCGGVALLYEISLFNFYYKDKNYLNMMNRFKFFGAIAAIAIFLTIFGYWAKITHQAYADTTLTIGMWLLAVCAAIYVYFMFANLRKK